MKDGPDDDAGDDAAGFGDEVEEDLALPPRFMVLRTEALACWRGTSRYLAMVSCFAMVSSRRVVTLLG